MTRYESPKLRCRRCGLQRVGADRLCPACGADLEVPGALESAAAGRQARPAEASRAVSRPARTAAAAPSTAPPGRPAPASAAPSPRPAPASVGPSPRPALERPISAARGIPIAPQGPLGRITDALGGLDASTRRTVLRLAAEVVILVIIVAIVASGTILKPRPAATPQPGATAPVGGITAPGLGIAAADITTVFQLPYAGSFAFTPAGGGQTGSSGTTARIAGESADGVTTLELTGPSTDVTRATFTIRVFNANAVDVIGLQRLTVFLLLYAPGAADQLLATLGEATGSGADRTLAVASDGLVASIETHLQPGGTVTVWLTPMVASPTASPAAKPVPASASPAGAPSPSRAPSAAPTVKAPTAAPSVKSSPRPS